MNNQSKGTDRKKQAQDSSVDLVQQVNMANSRLRILEDRLNNLNRKIEINENNDLQTKKRINLDIKTTNSDLVELKRELEQIKEKLEVITRELPNFASRDEVMVLKKYIDLWEPLNFVTRAELEKMLKELRMKN